MQTIRTGVFWLTYAVYLLIAFGGMVLTAQLGPIARDFGLENRMILLFGVTAPVLTFAVSIDNFANGITRPISGFSFGFAGPRKHDAPHVHARSDSARGNGGSSDETHGASSASAALIFLFWGEIFVIFPAICGDSFGVKKTLPPSNGLLYTSQRSVGARRATRGNAGIRNRNVEQRSDHGRDLQSLRGPAR